GRRCRGRRGDRGSRRHPRRLPVHEGDHPNRLRGSPGDRSARPLRGDPDGPPRGECAWHGPRLGRAMPLPYYVSPEQMMKDKAEYARKGIARGRSMMALEYRDGILLVAENPSTLLHKISEIYNRIAFAGVGKYNEFENLRVAGVRHADVKGYSYHREDVTAKALANAYSQALGNIFTEGIKPFEVEVLVVEVGDAPNGKNEMYHILYDGYMEDERQYAAMGGQADEIRRFLKDHYRDGLSLGDAVQLGVRALTVTQNKQLTERDLEVAVLDRNRERRKFRRIADSELRSQLGRAETSGTDAHRAGDSPTAGKP